MVEFGEFQTIRGGLNSRSRRDSRRGSRRRSSRRRSDESNIPYNEGWVEGFDNAASKCEQDKWNRRMQGALYGYSSGCCPTNPCCDDPDAAFKAQIARLNYNVACGSYTNLSGGARKRKANSKGRKANSGGRKANSEGRKANSKGRKANSKGRKSVIPKSKGRKSSPNSKTSQRRNYLSGGRKMTRQSRKPQSRKPQSRSRR